MGATRRSDVRRLFGLGGVLLCGAVLLGACGSSSQGALKADSKISPHRPVSTTSVPASTTTTTPSRTSSVVPTTVPSSATSGDSAGMGASSGSVSTGSPVSTPSSPPPAQAGPGLSVSFDRFASCDLAQGSYSIYVQYTNGASKTHSYTVSATGIGPGEINIAQDVWGNALATPLKVVLIIPQDVYDPNGCFTQ